MARVDFRVGRSRAWPARRAISATVDARPDARSGGEIERCDDEAVAYGGTARVDGVLRARARRTASGRCCRWRSSMRRRRCARDFELLCGAGAPTGRFGGVRRAATRDDRARRPASVVRATLHVPASAPFFADHFPRRPVFPGTLLHAMRHIDACAAARRRARRRCDGSRLRRARVSRREDARVHPPGRDARAGGRHAVDRSADGSAD